MFCLWIILLYFIDYEKTISATIPVKALESRVTTPFTNKFTNLVLNIGFYKMLLVLYILYLYIIKLYVLKRANEIKYFKILI
ncbi:hypothetical protein QTP88_010687 [Uroleucon formosanum]